MNDLKNKFEPALKLIDQMDTQSVLAITGVMVVLVLLFGGIADLLALVAGIGLGIAIHKKLLS